MIHLPFSAFEPFEENDNPFSSIPATTFEKSSKKDSDYLKTLEDFMTSPDHAHIHYRSFEECRFAQQKTSKLEFSAQPVEFYLPDLLKSFINWKENK